MRRRIVDWYVKRFGDRDQLRAQDPERYKKLFDVDRWEIRVRPSGTERGWLTPETVKDRYDCKISPFSGFNRMNPTARELVVEQMNREPFEFPTGLYQNREILVGERLGRAVWTYRHQGFDPEEREQRAPRSRRIDVDVDELRKLFEEYRAKGRL